MLQQCADTVKVGDKRFYKTCTDDFTHRIALGEDANWVWCAAIVTNVYSKTVDLEYKIPDREQTYTAKKVKISRLRKNVESSYHETAYDGFLDEQSVAQLELNGYINVQSQEIAPEIEIDSVADPDFGALYRVWNSRTLLGTFYQSADGKWIAQPCDNAAAFGGNLPPKTCLDDRPRCNTAVEAQLIIVAMSGLLVADTADEVVDLIDKPFDELTYSEWEAIKQQAQAAEMVAA